MILQDGTTKRIQIAVMGHGKAVGMIFWDPASKARLRMSFSETAQPEIALNDTSEAILFENRGGRVMAQRVGPTFRARPARTESRWRMCAP